MSSAAAATLATQEAAAVTIIGAGLAGALMAILLARRGHPVTIYERLPDMRRVAVAAGRSINLALAARGIRALERAGLLDAIQSLMIPMQARTLHGLDGSLTRIPYGQRPQEVIHSISRSALNCVLLDAAEQLGVQVNCGQPALAADFAQRQIRLRDDALQSERSIALSRIIAADGAGSVLRHCLIEQLHIACREELLEHGYKELTLPPAADAHYQIERDALHIWPRGEFMLIALPNLHGSFTVTLFLPRHGPHSFATPDTAEAVNAFFQQHFPDIAPLMPELATEFLAHPIGVVGTVRCSQWSIGDQMLLVGDAAHAITPFHGQGMNCAFEDCIELDAWLAGSADWATAFTQFERSRRPNTDAMADMALENYLEMRDTIRDPGLQLQKALALELERRHPRRFVPRYSMVTFHAEIPYAVAYARGAAQDAILAELSCTVRSLDDVDFARAERLIEEHLPPLA